MSTESRVNEAESLRQWLQTPPLACTSFRSRRARLLFCWLPRLRRSYGGCIELGNAGVRVGGLDGVWCSFSVRDFPHGVRAHAAAASHSARKSAVRAGSLETLRVLRGHQALFCAAVGWPSGALIEAAIPAYSARPVSTHCGIIDSIPVFARSPRQPPHGPLSASFPACSLPVDCSRGAGARARFRSGARPRADGFAQGSSTASSAPETSAANPRR